MTQNVIRDLGDGLILRRSTPEDAERLVAFNGYLHRETGAEEPETHVAAWTRDLMSGEHPAFDPGDFTIVEDTHNGSIVSTLCLIPQTWTYDGIRFGVGRPELVGTHPDYRRRGLIRAQFDVIHRWCEERGLQVQAITGIPYFYRQFGYEMALNLGGSRHGYKFQVPKLKDGEEEPIRLRPVVEADLPFVAQVYEYGVQRYPVACVWDDALWRYELLGKSRKNVNRQELHLIETPEGEPVGLIAHAHSLWGNRMILSAYELKPGVSWLDVTRAVVRYLWATGEGWAAQDPKQGMERFVLRLGADHPAYRVFAGGLPHVSPPYAWYLRVPNLPGFLRHLAPALNRRLAESPLAGHSGKVKISFYRSGMQLSFEAGRLVAVEPWQPVPGDDGDAGFPDLIFLQLLFGYRSMEELDHAFADCWASPDRARPLLEALFPKRPSDVWPVS